MHPLIVRAFEFYSSVELSFVFWWRRHFLVEKIIINTCVLQDPFLVKIPLIRVGYRIQDISMYRHSWGPSQVTLGPLVGLVVRHCFASRECEADKPCHRPPGRCRRPIKGPPSP